MTPKQLQHELEDRGLEVLGVTEHHADPAVLVVYLHGCSGQWQGNEARLLIASVPDVAEATPGAAPSIVLARVKPLPEPALPLVPVAQLPARAPRPRSGNRPA